MFSDRFHISLGDFNQEYFDSLADNRRIVAPTFKNEDFYHTVYADGQPIGVAGVILSSTLSDTGFVQIVLTPDWRGRGLIGPIYRKLAERHDLTTLYATIDEDNKVSQQAHRKLGFKSLSSEKIADLRQRGLLQPNQIRLIKELN